MTAATALNAFADRKRIRLSIRLHLMRAHVVEQAAVTHLGADIQDATGYNVSLALSRNAPPEDYNRDRAGRRDHLHVVQLPKAKRGFVVSQRRWMLEQPLLPVQTLQPTGLRLRALCRTLAGFRPVTLLEYVLKHAAALDKG